MAILAIFSTLVFGCKKAATESVAAAPGVPAWLATHNNNAKIGLLLDFSKLKS